MIEFLDSRSDEPTVLGQVIVQGKELFATEGAATIVQAHLGAGRSAAEFVTRYRSWSNGYISSREVPDPDLSGSAQRDAEYRAMFDAFVEQFNLDVEYDNWPKKAQERWDALVQLFNDRWERQLAESGVR